MDCSIGLVPHRDPFAESPPGSVLRWLRARISGPHLGRAIGATRCSRKPGKDCHVPGDRHRQALRVASGEGLADVWWKSGRVTVKTAGAETGNAFSQIETDDPHGSGPPLHLHHNEDETFYVLEGEVTIVVGDERIDLEAGRLRLRAPRDRSRLRRPLGARTHARHRQPRRGRTVLRQPRRSRHRHRAPGRSGHAADGRADAPVRRLRLRDRRPRRRRSATSPRRHATRGAARLWPRPLSGEDGRGELEVGTLGGQVSKLTAF